MGGFLLMKKKPYQCLYVVKYKQTNLVKIGISNNWYERAKALQAGIKTTPLAVVLTENNTQAEKELHKKFDAYRLPGSEYFLFDQELLGQVLSEVFKHGPILSNWRNYPSRPPCPELTLLEQDFIEVTATIKRQIFRRVRLNYKTKNTCILEYLHTEWPEDVVRYFTVYLDIQVQKRKLKSRDTWTKDWALRLDVVEDYLHALFKYIRVYTHKNLSVFKDFTLESFTYTTINSCVPIKYKNLPLLARIIFERTWHSYDLYQDLLSVQNLITGHDKHGFEFYLESYGPLYYTKNSLLPVPTFTCKL